MTDTEVSKIKEMISGMTAEERDVVVRSLPSEVLKIEIQRRETIVDNTLDVAWDIITKASRGLSLEEMDVLVYKLDKAIKME